MPNNNRNYYVLCDDNCRFPAMTAEQVLEAIAEATGATPTHVDDAFITKIQEQNNQATIKLWIGTEAEYNALTTKALNTIYGIRREGAVFLIPELMSKDEIEQLVEAEGGKINIIKVNGTALEITNKTVDIPVPEMLDSNRLLTIQPAGTDVNNSTSFHSISDALDSLPKNLNGHTVTISLYTGVTEDVAIEDFFNGQIIIRSFVGEQYTITGDVDIENTSCRIEKVKINGALNLNNSQQQFCYLYVSNVEMNGDGINMLDFGYALIDAVTVKNATNGLRCNKGIMHIKSNVNIQSSVSFGVYVGNDSALVMGQAFTNNAQTQYNVQAGGRLFIGQQSNVPSY